MRRGGNKPEMKHHLDILGAAKIDKSGNTLYNLVNAKKRTGALWTVSENTVLMFEQIERKLRAIFKQNPRKISDRNWSVSFLQDSDVIGMVDFLEESSCMSKEICESVLCQTISLYIRIRIYKHLKYTNDKIAPIKKALRTELKETKNKSK